jgi:hypothetical protein
VRTSKKLLCFSLEYICITKTRFVTPKPSEINLLISQYSDRIIDKLGFDSQHGADTFLFPKPCISPLLPIQCHIQRVQGTLFPGLKWPDPERNHSRPTNFSDVNVTNCCIKKLFLVAKQPYLSSCRLIFEVSRPYSDTWHLVGLLWTKGRSLTEIFTWDIYLTSHNTWKSQICMLTEGLEPAIPASNWPFTYTLDCAATGISSFTLSYTYS